jgi:hypothetical protein
MEFGDEMYLPSRYNRLILNRYKNKMFVYFWPNVTPQLASGVLIGVGFTIGQVEVTLAKNI